MVTEILMDLLAISSLTAVNAPNSNIVKYSNQSAGIDASWVACGETNYMNILDNNYGYVLFKYSTYAMPFTDDSNLVLGLIDVSFTPGIAAHEYSDKYSSNSKLKKGYIEAKYINNYQDYSQGYKRTSSVRIIEFWPQSTTFVTTITSSFSQSFSIDLNLNFGDRSGISSGGGAYLEQTGNASVGFGYQISSTETTSTVSEDPLLSSQRASDDPERTIYWNYTILNANIAGVATYRFQGFVLLEVAKDNVGYDAYSTMTEFTIKFQNQYCYSIINDFWFDTPVYSTNFRINPFVEGPLE